MKILGFCGVLFLCWQGTGLAIQQSAPRTPSVDQSGLSPSFSNWQSLQRASDLIAQKRYEEAIKVLEPMGESSLWSFWQKLLLAKAHEGLGATNRVLEILENLPSPFEITLSPTQDFFQTLYRDALQIKKEALRKTGKSAASIEALLWALFPDEKQPNLEPVPPAATASEKILRFHILYSKKNYEEAARVATLPEISASQLPLTEKCPALFEWGNAARQSRRRAEAHEAFAKIVQWDCPGEELARAFYWKGIIETRDGQLAEAVKTWHSFIEKFPDHRYTDDAYHSLWKIARKQGQSRLAIEAYDHLMALPQGDMRNKVLWDNAHDFYKKGNFQKAIFLFDRILQSRPTDDETHPQALYWKARALEKSKLPATSVFNRLMTEFPFSFYATLAAARQGKRVAFPDIPDPVEETPLDPAFQEMAVVVNALNASGLQREARQVLDYSIQLNRERLDGVKRLLAVLWMEAGDYHMALTTAAETLETPVTGVVTKNDPLVRVFYASAFPLATKEGYSRTALPTGLIDAIMREESLFDTDIRSSAGAVGVMQLMPATAARQAAHMGLAGFSLKDLEDPEKNIQLGSMFLDRMVDLFNQNVPLAVMAYNAGPGNARKWVKSKGHLPLDEFIEEIPFSETKGYVKRVLRSASAYAFFSSDKLSLKPMFTMKVR